MSGAIKKAALLVHGLSSVDQRWILARLPGEVRERMTPLLAELKELGFDAATFPDISAEAEARFPVSAANQSDTELTRYRAAVVRVDRCSPRTVIQWASSEGDWVIGQVLVHRAWSWNLQFMNALAPYRRKQIEKSCKEAIRLPTRMGEQLIAQLDLALQQFELLASHASGGRNPDAAARYAGIGTWLRSFVTRT